MTGQPGSGGVRDRLAAYRRGLLAEALVALILRLRGYVVIARRFRCSRGEIDIIARRGSLVVFIEVKARTAAAEADLVLPAARRRILAAAEVYIARHPALAGHDRRFDVALVSRRALPRFVENAFGAQV